MNNITRHDDPNYDENGDMLDYIIIGYDEDDISEMIFEINHLKNNGYNPVGGIATRVGSSRGAYLLQAMVKGE